MTDDIGDEWLAHLLWRDWLDAWRLIGEAVEQWERLYVPFFRWVP